MMRKIISLVLAVLVMTCQVYVYAAEHTDDFGREIYDGEAPGEYFVAYLYTTEDVEAFLAGNGIPGYAYPSHAVQVPENFVEWKRLSSLGIFKSFCVTGDPVDLNYYAYELVPDGSEGIIKLYVEHGNAHDYSGDIALTIFDVDGSMGQLSDSASWNELGFSIVCREEMTYVYEGKKLKCIEWEQNGMALRLSYSIPGNEKLPDDCLIDRILSLDDADFCTAKAELLAIGSKDFPPTGDMVVFPVYMLSLSAWVLIILVQKKKHT